MEFNVFETKRKRGEILKEFFADGVWKMTFGNKGEEKELVAYSVKDLSNVPELNLYNGHDPKELMDSGRDILGEELLKNGEPRFDEVKKVLSPTKAGGYSFLSGFASWSGVMVNSETGNVYPQSMANDRKPSPIFAPTMVDVEVCESTPKQFLLDGRLPIMFSVHSNAEKVVEFMYFVEPGDPDRDPIVWIRTKRYTKKNPEQFTLDYRIVARSRLVQARAIETETFMTALVDTVAYWTKFLDKGARFDIPEKLLERVATGAMITCATTFSCDHAHYGHNIYGEEVHDNFPPNYIWTLEACCVMGYTAWAKRIFNHLLTHILNDEGRFFYRQGVQELFGASAEEYGWLLFLANKYSKQLGAETWTEEEWQKIGGMGRIIIDNCVPCPQFGNRVLVYMCAEADTNTRVHAYVNNNFWAVRGLNALAELLENNGRVENKKEFAEMADVLYTNITELIKEQTVEDETYGSLPPFRLGYTAKPLNFSICRATSEPVSEEYLENYLHFTYMRSQGNSDHDLTENTYANYRYYPEMLGAMMLDESQASAIVKMREAFGGEYAGMSRFLGRIDDWPVLPYARYLLESERIEKYLLLLYSHTCHHGNPDLMCYYEQITPTSVVADDCVPSLLTTPIMSAWMFAYETMNEKTLSLLRGIPKAWFDKGFSAKGLGWTEGTLDIEAKDNTVTVEFSAPLEKSAEIVWRKKTSVSMANIAEGAEFVEKCQGNRIVLKKNLKKAFIKII
ncbi:MAG: hypothetical protein E7412_07715 [Ruminococcaceae bacterium]|nr:hypothetical protein [Oscillospiraceae bacterium]